MACRFLLLLELTTILALLVLPCEATTYMVGDLAGWDTSADLSSWPATKHFYVGDALLFQYSQYHNVNEVDKEGYRNCNASNAILTSSNGNTSVTLTTTGEKYFICGVLSHCLGGMKLQIKVLGKITSSPPPQRSPPQFPSPPWLPQFPSPPSLQSPSPPSLQFPSPPSRQSPSPPSPTFSPRTPSTTPSSPSLGNIVDGLFPQANGSLHGLRCNLVLVLCCCIGGLFWILF
ncbi:hypothetical protein KFK09_018930 [Dendrobium nobile]|uniref:Phytocyanin domain-containing protein n=1 Tax=Dendrobium nobile TaxID=94219 RepID=A0A8T3AXB1_DENNO|nr:hypothetical protein KFK09_018930 [Dendrobium nobile]